MKFMSKKIIFKEELILFKKSYEISKDKLYSIYIESCNDNIKNPNNKNLINKMRKSKLTIHDLAIMFNEAKRDKDLRQEFLNYIDLKDSLISKLIYVEDIQTFDCVAFVLASPFQQYYRNGNKMPVSICPETFS